jgi:hypothetical protein
VLRASGRSRLICFADGRMFGAMSETTFYAILFFGTFPVLWLFAWWLDRIWRSNSELEARGTREAKESSWKRA